MPKPCDGNVRGIEEVLVLKPLGVHYRWQSCIRRAAAGNPMDGWDGIIRAGLGLVGGSAKYGERAGDVVR